MMRCVRLGRALRLAYAALQLVLPGVASIADGRLDAASIRDRPVAHLEDHTGPHCARVHPADCAFCGLLSMSARPATVDRGQPGPVRRIAPPADGVVVCARMDRRATRSRAPPIGA